MKKIILSLFALLVTLSVDAQIQPYGKTASGINNGVSKSDVSLSNKEYSKTNYSVTGWDKAIVSYVSPTLDKDLDFGISAGYLTTYKFDKKIELFLEYGGVISYGRYSEKSSYEEYDYSKEEEDPTSQIVVCKETETYVDIKIPVNLAYRFSVKGKLGIIPYIGVNLKCGIIGSQKLEVGSESEKYNMYDAEDVGTSKELSRLNFGMQYGLSLTYKKISLGYGWERDLTETLAGVKYNSSMITVGYLF